MSDIKTDIEENCKGIRPKSHHRLISLDIILNEYCRKNDLDKSELIEDLDPEKLKRYIVDTVSNYSNKSMIFLIGLNNRTLKDYIKVLQYFN